MTRVYLAGPMTGCAAWNFPTFDEARDRGRALGLDIVSPADIDRACGIDETTLRPEDITPAMRREFVRRDLAAIQTCDAIAMLPGWEKSTGARAEHAVAKWLGLPILDARTFGPLAPTVKLIGLAGYARVGKDSISAAAGYRRAAFADALKAAVDPLFPAGTAKEAKRDTYVAYGKAMRAIDPGHWVARLTLPEAGPVPACVCDVRYADEVAHLHRLGGIVVRVIRPGFDPANEEERDSFNVIDQRWRLPRLVNDGTIEQAVRRLRELVQCSAPFAPPP